MRNVIILGIVSFLTDVSSEMVYPLIPLYLTVKLGATPALVGLIEGISESLASFLKVGSGYFSDRIRRRKSVTISGYSCSSIGKVLLYLSTSWTWVLSGRVVDRIGKGIRTAPRDALIAESTAPGQSGRAFGLHRTLDTMGAVLGASLAFILLLTYEGDYQRVFLISLIPAVAGVFVLFAVKEARRLQGAARRAKHGWGVLDRRLKLFLLVILLFSLGNSSNQFLILRAKNLGFSVEMSVLLYVTFNVVHAISSYPLGSLSDRVGRRRLLVFGYSAYGAVYLALALISDRVYLWFIFAAYGLYLGATEGVEKAFVSDLAPADLKATLLGMHATLVGIGLLPASILAGVLWTALGPAATFLFGGLVGFAAALGLYLLGPSSR
jgi:MFS family permease